MLGLSLDFCLPPQAASWGQGEGVPGLGEAIVWVSGLLVAILACDSPSAFPPALGLLLLGCPGARCPPSKSVSRGLGVSSTLSTGGLIPQHGWVRTPHPSTHSVDGGSSWVVGAGSDPHAQTSWATQG